MTRQAGCGNACCVAAAPTCYLWLGICVAYPCRNADQRTYARRVPGISSVCRTSAMPYRDCAASAASLIGGPAGIRRPQRSELARGNPYALQQSGNFIRRRGVFRRGPAGPLTCDGFRQAADAVHGPAVLHDRFKSEIPRASFDKPNEFIGALEIAAVYCSLGEPLPELGRIADPSHGTMRGRRMSKPRNELFQVRNCCHHDLIPSTKIARAVGTHAQSVPRGCCPRQVAVTRSE